MVAVAVVRDRVAPEVGEGDGEGFVGFDGGVAGDLDCDGLGVVTPGRRSGCRRWRCSRIRRWRCRWRWHRRR